MSESNIDIGYSEPIEPIEFDTYYNRSSGSSINVIRNNFDGTPYIPTDDVLKFINESDEKNHEKIIKCLNVIIIYEFDGVFNITQSAMIATDMNISINAYNGYSFNINYFQLDGEDYLSCISMEHINLHIKLTDNNPNVVLIVRLDRNIDFNYNNI